MRKRVAINGFGRMGRLALRAAWDSDYDIVHINELNADIHTAAHLLSFDSIHGKWEKEVTVDDNALVIDGKQVTYSGNKAIKDTDWESYDTDIVVECTGKHKSSEALQAYFEFGVKKVVVSCPVKEGALNIVMGVNDALYDHSQHDIVTAASCTTNCLAPVVKVIHEQFGIIHGSITTIHNFTNTQSILDTPHKDLRRARASSLSLIPTSTGSATAIGFIFPEL
ncbi:MAG: type I glyceraldehyde-3-phosphate dehydrogenase, partial [Candidatus Scalindua sp.]|nr:type I glyceraldehyde-3-phosphate dehydrogenase [Candidatus Scalindua sp.]